MKRTNCSFPGCDRKCHARSLCGSHLAQRRRGQELRPIKRESRDISRFRELYDIDANGCWIWNGTMSHGYGIVKNGKRHVLAHRHAFEAEHGGLSGADIIDHKCRVKRCVNPGHLQLATRKTNGENAGLSNANTSGARGVYWDARNGKWCVTVKHHGRSVWGGRYAELDEAESAAVALRNRLFTNNLEDRLSPA